MFTSTPPGIIRLTNDLFSPIHCQLFIHNVALRERERERGIVHSRSCQFLSFPLAVAFGRKIQSSSQSKPYRRKTNLAIAANIVKSMRASPLVTAVSSQLPVNNHPVRARSETGRANAGLHIGNRDSKIPRAFYIRRHKYHARA